MIVSSVWRGMCSVNYEEGLDRAARYLAYQPRTRRQLVDHLRGRGVSADDADRIADLMESYHLLDDMEYTKMYIESRLDMGRGMNRIRQELRQAGIDGSMIEDALFVMEDLPDEYETARMQAREAVRGENVGAMDHAARQKLMARIARRLAGRGFSTDTVYRAVRAALDEAARDREED